MTQQTPTNTTRDLLSQRSDLAFLWLVRIYDSQQTFYRIVNDTQSLVGPDGHTYAARPFTVTPPKVLGLESPVMQVNITVIDRQVIDQANIIAQSERLPKIDVHQVQRSVLQTGSQTRHQSLRAFTGFDISNVRHNGASMSFEVSLRNYFDSRVAKITFNPGDFPGLF